MSAARDTFLMRLAAFRAAASDPVLLDHTPPTLAAGSVASVLRNGLCVVGFAMLEDFLKARVEEVFSSIGQTGVSFGQLPKGLREFATVYALRGLPGRMQMEHRAGNDPIAFGQLHSGIIASTATSSYRLSNLGFGLHSNLAADEIGGVLKACQVDKAWEQMDSLSQRIGSGVLFCKQAYLNAASRRHRAAHTPTAAVTTGDLISYSREAFAIALGFDLLLSRALRFLQAGDLSFCTASFKLGANHVEFRFVRQLASDRWGSLREGGQRASRVNASGDEIRTWTEAIARQGGEAVVIQDLSGAPVRWSFPIVS